MSPEWMAPWMFGALVIVLLAGFPVAFSLAAIAAVFGAVASLPSLWPVRPGAA